MTPAVVVTAAVVVVGGWWLSRRIVAALRTADETMASIFADELDQY